MWDGDTTGRYYVGNASVGPGVCHDKQLYTANRCLHNSPVTSCLSWVPSTEDCRENLLRKVVRVLLDNEGREDVLPGLQLNTCVDGSKPSITANPSSLLNLGFFRLPEYFSYMILNVLAFREI